MSIFDRQHIPRRAMLARLPDAGAPGLSAYRTPGHALPLDRLTLDDEARSELDTAYEASATGAALFANARQILLVIPPFPVLDDLDFDEAYPGPLVELLQRKRSLAVFLLRLGGFSVGFFRGDTLVDSKTDQRFVKNRHRKGGQSQRRFDRIREKHMDELFDKACVTSREKLAPYDAEIEHVFLGGTRQTLIAFHRVCSYFDSYGARLMPRILPITSDPRRSTLEAAPHEIWSSDVFSLALD